MPQVESLTSQVQQLEAVAREKAGLDVRLDSEQRGRGEAEDRLRRALQVGGGCSMVCDWAVAWL